MARKKRPGGEYKSRTIYLPTELWKKIDESGVEKTTFLRQAAEEKLQKYSHAEAKISRIKEIVNQ